MSDKIKKLAVRDMTGGDIVVICNAIGDTSGDTRGSHRLIDIPGEIIITFTADAFIVNQRLEYAEKFGINRGLSVYEFVGSLFMKSVNQ